VTPGERQTVARVRHHEFGEGTLVHRNGPASFTADSGEVVAFEKVAFGGSRSGPPPYSYTFGFLADGSKVELEQTGRDHGKRHDRIIAVDGRAGWLVDWFDEFDNWCFIFEPDHGAPEKFAAGSMWVGGPKDRGGGKKWPPPHDREKLRTVQGRRGLFTFSYEANPWVPKGPSQLELKLGEAVSK